MTTIRDLNQPPHVDGRVEDIAGRHEPRVPPGPELLLGRHGATFDPKVDGHWSRQVGDQPLETLFVRG